jgi:hypothetical protein
VIAAGNPTSSLVAAEVKRAGDLTSSAEFHIMFAAAIRA